MSVVTHDDGTRVVGLSPSVCLSVFLSRISQKTSQFGSSNLTNVCHTMSPGHPFILWLKDQRSRVTKTVLAWVFVLL